MSFGPEWKIDSSIFCQPPLISNMHNFHQVFHAAIKLCVCAARKTLIPLPHAPSRPVLETDRCAHQKQTDTLTETTEQWPRVSAVPYLGDDLPGGRQVQTAYGSIRVFEWGPEEGEKLLIVHGLSTPCIALGSLGKSFVSKGYRVMMFGKSFVASSCLPTSRSIGLKPISNVENRCDYPYLPNRRRPLR